MDIEQAKWKLGGFAAYACREMVQIALTKKVYLNKYSVFFDDFYVNKQKSGGRRLPMQKPEHTRLCDILPARRMSTSARAGLHM